MEHELILVIDFGGLYNQLIVRRVREQKVYCEILPYTVPISTIISKKPKGIIFTGGPSVITDENAPNISSEIFELGIPILGICYGCQLIGHAFGGKIKDFDIREYGKTCAQLDNNSLLFENMEKNNDVIMSHTYSIECVPDNFNIIASTQNCNAAAIENSQKNIYGVQFHPEVTHTIAGTQIIKNFLFKICKVSGDWKMKNFILDMKEKLRDTLQDKKVLCALSGGVDSSVAALLIHKIAKENLTCIFVDHGLLRLDEGDQIMEEFSKFGINIVRVNAQQRFLSKLKGVVDPEIKRKIIGEEFIRVFEEEANKLGLVDFLVQGTIYPDIIESGFNNSAVIKSHHNVGGLPKNINFKEIVEPLRDLFKDEVREVGIELGIREDLVFRQPFPGPGLAVRIIGEITQEKLEILRKADFIFREEIKNNGLDRKIWQYFAVLTNLRSVGVMGDERTYGYTIALRAVDSIDAMTADWYRIPFDILEKISIKIVAQVKDVNRIVYDITSKPPATIEWE